MTTHEVAGTAAGRVAASSTGAEALVQGDRHAGRHRDGARHSGGVRLPRGGSPAEDRRGPVPRPGQGRRRASGVLHRRDGHRLGRRPEEGQPHRPDGTDLLRGRIHSRVAAGPGRGERLRSREGRRRPEELRRGRARGGGRRARGGRLHQGHRSRQFHRRLLLGTASPSRRTRRPVRRRPAGPQALYAGEDQLRAGGHIRGLLRVREHHHEAGPPGCVRRHRLLGGNQRRRRASGPGATRPPVLAGRRRLRLRNPRSGLPDRRIQHLAHPSVRPRRDDTGGGHRLLRGRLARTAEEAHRDGVLQADGRAGRTDRLRVQPRRHLPLHGDVHAVRGQRLRRAHEPPPSSSACC